MFKLQVKEIARGQYDVNEAIGQNYKITTTKKLIFQRENSGDIRFIKDDINIYILEGDKWLLIDHTIPLDNKYNKMLLDAQRNGYSNVFDAICNNYSFKY